MGIQKSDKIRQDVALGNETSVRDFTCSNITTTLITKSQSIAPKD